MAEKKEGQSNRNAKADSILRLANANVHLARGSALASAESVSNFLQELSPDNVFHKDVTLNGFVKGAVSAWVTLMAESAELAEKSLYLWLPHLKPPDDPSASTAKKR